MSLLSLKSGNNRINNNENRMKSAESCHKLLLYICTHGRYSVHTEKKNQRLNGSEQIAERAQHYIYHLYENQLLVKLCTRASIKRQKHGFEKKYRTRALQSISKCDETKTSHSMYGSNFLLFSQQSLINVAVDQRFFGAVVIVVLPIVAASFQSLQYIRVCAYACLHAIFNRFF